MAKLSKRVKAFENKVDPEKMYPLQEAFQLVKDTATAKFDESVEVAVNLGVNARKSDQNVRGATVMPKGTGKSVRVAVFADGDLAEQAKAAGADLVGMEELAAKVKGGEMDFDLCIAAPDAMRVVGQLGQILGPRGLMPNPKVGTVTKDITTAVNNAKSGQVQFRTEKGGIIHCAIGKVSFSVEDLNENLEALMSDLLKAKPSSAKGQYIRRVSLSSTMGPGVKVERSSLSL